MLSAGETAQAGDNGSVIILDASGTTVGFLDSPWAVDAAGQPVPTSYSINGSTITQTVDLSSTAISSPVVADPSLWSVIANAVDGAAELASFVFVGAKVVKEFAEAEKIVMAAKKAISFYEKLGGSVSKVVKLLKAYVKNRASLSSAQISALEGLFKYAGTAFFNVLGIGNCWSLATSF